MGRSFVKVEPKAFFFFFFFFSSSSSSKPSCNKGVGGAVCVRVCVYVLLESHFSKANLPPTGLFRGWGGGEGSGREYVWGEIWFQSSIYVPIHSR